MKIDWQDIDWINEGPDRHRYIATVFDGDSQVENIPTVAIVFVVWLQDLIMQIPEDLSAFAKLNLRDDDCYECSSERARFYLYLERYETDEEFAARQGQEMAKAAKEVKKKAEEKEKRDRSEYERLKRKFEGENTSL